MKILEICAEGTECLRFANADGKAWVMPTRRMDVAMQLYQPSGPKGRLLKAVLPHICRLPGSERLIHGERLRCRLQPDIDAMLRELLEQDSLQWAVFEGTPCAHRKVTVQLSRADRILAYAKLSASQNVHSLFRREAEMLKMLAERGMTGIPRILHCGKADGGYMLLQTTEKTMRSTVAHHWGSLQEDFLADLYARSATVCTFADTEMHANIAALAARPQLLADAEQRRVALACARKAMDRLGGQRLRCHAAHGDFTPWNAFVERGRLFVFDWEYAYRRCPIDLDRYHFFTQTAVFERHLDADAIFAEAQGWAESDDYSLYLLDMIARYALRDNGSPDPAVQPQIATWTRLLTLLNA